MWTESYLAHIMIFCGSFFKISFLLFLVLHNTMAAEDANAATNTLHLHETLNNHFITAK